MFGNNFDVGEEFDFSASILNSGTSGTGLYDIAVYVTTNTAFSNPVFLFEEEFGNISAGQTEAIDFYAFINGTWQTGDYYLAFLVDSNDDVSESDETNNVVYTQFSLNGVSTPPPSTQPDIISNNFTITSASTSVLPGAAMHFTWDIANVGNGDQPSTPIAGVYPTAGIYLSNDSNVTTADILLHEQIWSDLIAGTLDSRGQLDVVLPSDLSPGTYHLAVIADNNGDISESDEENNVSNIQTITVLPQPTEAELFVTGASLDTATIQEGGTASISYVINNSGGTRASNSWSGIWLSTDAIFGNGDDVFLAEDIVDVDPGEADAESELLEDLATLSAGTYHLFVETNHNGDISESDKSNNVSGPVELTVEAPEAPTVALINQITTLAEDTSTATRIKVADIVVTDDALGSETLALTGTDAALFEIDDTALYVVAAERHRHGR